MLITGDAYHWGMTLGKFDSYLEKKCPLATTVRLTLKKFLQVGSTVKFFAIQSVLNKN
jgi:hypothetical protein